MRLEAMPEGDLLRVEYTRVMADLLLKIGADPELLRHSVREWIEADFSVREALRHGRYIRRLRRLTVPRPFRVDSSGGVALTSHDEGAESLGVQFGDIAVSWNLPWSSTIEVWIGLRGRPGTNYRLRPRPKQEGEQALLDSFTARRVGLRRIQQPGEMAGLHAGWRRYKFAFVLVVAESPFGNRYRWLREMKLK
jgi:hypothetical protein